MATAVASTLPSHSAISSFAGFCFCASRSAIVADMMIAPACARARTHTHARTHGTHTQPQTQTHAHMHMHMHMHTRYMPHAHTTHAHAHTHANASHRLSSGRMRVPAIVCMRPPVCVLGCSAQERVEVCHGVRTHLAAAGRVSGSAGVRGCRREAHRL